MYNILPEHSAKNHKVTLKKMKRKKNPEGGEKGLKLSESISVPLTRYSHMIQFLGILALYHDHARKKKMATFYFCSIYWLLCVT